MGEENQTTQTSDIRDRMSGIKRFRMNLRLAKTKEDNKKLDSDSNSLFEKSLSVPNQKISSKYNQASQATAVAGMIKSFAESNGDDWSDLTTPKDILTEYYRLNPGDDVYNKIMEFTHSSRDPEEFGVEMGWIKKNALEKAWDWTKNVGKSFVSFFETGGDAVANLVQGTIGALEGDQTPGALENYAKMNYGKDFYSLSESEKKEAMQAVSTNEGLETYKPTPQRTISRGAESGLDAFFSIYAPGLKLGLATASETPYLRNVVQGFGQVVELGGYIINKIPGLSNFRDSLQTEEEKKQWDEFVGSIGLMKLLQKRGGRNTEGVKDTIIKEIDPETTIKEFQKRVMDAPKDIKETLGNLRDGKATVEKLEDTAGKIVKSKTVEENAAATRALQEIDTEGIKTYEQLEKALNDRGAEIEVAEDAEYSKDTTKYKPEETRNTKTYTKDGYSTSVELRPIEDGIELLRDFYEGSPEKLAQLDLIEQKFHNEGLTKWEINSIARAISQEFDTYKARGQQKTSIASKNVEEIRRAVKNFAREGNERLVELDKAWSDNMNTKAMVKDLQNEIVKFKNTLANKNIFQKFAGKVGNILNFFGGKDLLGKLFPKMAGDNTLNAITRQEQLSSMIEKFERLNKRINGTKTKTDAQKIIDEIIDEFDVGPVEGDVIVEEGGYVDPNKYLEDIVEVK